MQGLAGDHTGWRGRPPLDKDVVVDIRGIYYLVVGYYHYDDMVTVIPKYVPTRDPRTPWRIGNIGYKRIIGDYGVEGVRSALATLTSMKIKILRPHPAYGGIVPQLGRDEIVEIMYPERGLENLLKSGASDELEDAAISLIYELESNFKGIRLGVTGSLLSKMHKPGFSDIDLVVYGLDNVSRVSAGIWDLEGVERLDDALLEEMAIKYWREGRLPLEVARRSVRRRWTRFRYRGIMVSLLPVLAVHEATALPKPRVELVCGRVRLRGRIFTTDYTPVYPPRLRLEVKEVIRGEVSCEEVELMCLEHLYAYAFEEGEAVRVEGLMQRVKCEGGVEYERVVVGGLEAGGKIEYC